MDKIKKNIAWILLAFILAVLWMSIWTCFRQQQRLDRYDRAFDQMYEDGTNSVPHSSLRAK